MVVQVLLSTYNGEPFLAAQLDSLLAQDHPQVEILIRDDGSTDSTVAILQDYAAAFPHIRLIEGTNVGFARSFLALLQEASPDAEYLALCDQDDVWHPDKLSRAAVALGRVAPGTPALYTSRLTVADARLRPVGASAVPRKGLSFANALVENSAAGCATVINRAAIGVLRRRVPEYLAAHDGWIYLVVSAFGCALYDETATLLFRRHGANASEYSFGWVRNWGTRLRRVLRNKRRGFVAQARELRRLYGAELPVERRQLLDRFLCQRPRYRERLAYALAGDVYRQSPLDHFVMQCLIVLDRL
jgi:glycosyltransferase involved in cell wall biosynthesis